MQLYFKIVKKKEGFDIVTDCPKELVTDIFDVIVLNAIENLVDYNYDVKPSGNGNNNPYVTINTKIDFCTPIADIPLKVITNQDFKAATKILTIMLKAFNHSKDLKFINFDFSALYNS